MAEERTRVDFNAPESLVERADAVADLLDISRTQLLIDALRDEIDDIVGDESVRRRLRQAYYEDRVDFETVESILGTEEAIRVRLLRESLDRDPPEPRVEADDLPSQAEFYADGVPERILDGDGDDERDDGGQSQS